MDIALFESSPVGELVPITVSERGIEVDHWAFSPHPLPHTLDLTPATWKSAIDAAHHLGRVDALANELISNPLLIARPTIRREAISTSALEGTFSTMEEIFESELAQDAPQTDALTEVLNFVSAIEYGIERLDELPISTRFVCDLQQVLIANTKSADWQLGALRATQVLIGPYRGASIREARYIPPPPGPILEQGMTDWERWIHANNDLHAVIKVAAAHYQFEALHPFTDGNGRIGRLVAILQLIDYGLISEPLINLSSFFELNADKYRYLLREVSISGDFDSWIAFFCEALVVQTIDAESKIRALITWKNGIVQQLRAARLSGTALDVAEDLIAYPTLNVQSVAKRYGVSVQTANTSIARLTTAGVISEVSGRSYDRVFQATAVFDILLDRSR